ncbi:MAG: polysaccharide pyruvyl transferase CsaB [Bacteroidota bacterium]|nr:MAG: polysaccharide pyruvyl transferase CsaB [Bacteroidota bacterium]
MASKVIIRGYYGFGNLGDDVLMLVSYKLIRKIFPQADVLVCSNSNTNEYIHSFLGERVQLIKDHDPVVADWILDGGGGVYFDFSSASKIYKLLNTLLKLFGIKWFKFLYKKYRNIKGAPGIFSKFKAGIGIGVGTYSGSSSKYYADMILLSEYNFLSVRDTESESNIRKMGFNYPVFAASDLAFLTQYWCSQTRINEPESKSTCVGFILRDWKFNAASDYASVKETTKRLQAMDIKVMFFSFDRIDSAYKKEFGECDFNEWNPAEVGLENYLAKLRQCSLVVTSRAHGGIMAACLGIPAICIAIEPKLKVVHQMLKNSSGLLESPIAPDALLAEIQSRLARKDLVNSVRLDVELNRIKMEAAYQKLSEFVKQTV